MLNNPLPLRPHHGMCLRFYRGLGYSEAFASHMTQIQSGLTPGTMVTLTDGPDEICAACPNNLDGRCTATEKVSRYDGDVLALCGLRAGDTLAYGTFAALVENRILAPGRREEICGDCQWSGICRRSL